MPTTAETRYARAADGTHVAYQVTGDGPLDIVWLRAWHSNVEHEWEEPVLARMLRRLGSMGRVIRLDQRGTGLSDRIVHRAPPTIEDRSDDIRAVLDAVGARQVVLIGLASAATLCAVFAATHPERTRGLVLYHLEPGRAWGDDSAPPDDPRLERFLGALRESWGTEELAARQIASSAPSRADDRGLIRWLAEEQRLSGTAEDAIALARIDHETDVRAVLPTIHVPTLVLAREASEAASTGRAVADAIAAARFVPLPGADHMLLAGDTDAALRAITEFLDEVQAYAEPDTEPDRVLATLLMTDVVDSTVKAESLGDRHWAALLEEHNARLRAVIARHRGLEVDSAGDGFLTTFDGPGRAIRCAVEAATVVRDLGIEIRAGIHTGEVEQVDDRLRGIAVHIAARVAAAAGPSEVLVSRTVKDLVAGSGLAFDDRGSHSLKGVTGEWGLFAVRQLVEG